MTLVGGLAIGVVQSLLGLYASSVTGLSTSVPFFLIMLVLVVRGRSLPLRDFFLERLPAVGSGRVRPGVLVPTLILVALLITQVSTTWADAFATTFATGLVLLSILVVTGYAGQISLAQFAIAGFGAWVAGRLVAAQGFSFPPALLVGVLVTIPIGVLFALPAVRTRGINLAVVTFGLGTAMQYMLFQNADYTGGFGGTSIGDANLFGLDIGAIIYPDRYAIFCMLVLVVAGLGVANVRRGRTGRRLLAVRANERAAAALGISVPQAKLYAFGLGAAIAALGGILLAFRSESIVFSDYDNVVSITFVSLAVIGGVGYIFGASFLGATLASGALGAALGDLIFGGLEKYLGIITGATVILLVLQNQNGIALEMEHQVKWVERKLRLQRLVAKLPAFVRWQPGTPETLGEGRRERVPPQELVVDRLTVRYGAVVAVEDVSLTVSAGKVVGLIGPNGAGKTTFIDAVTGFTAPSSGTIALGGRQIAGWSATARARDGLSRSFQSLELFEEMTVRDNLRTASEPRDLVSYLRDLVYPKVPPLPPEVVTAIREFGLEDDLDRQVEDLPYGQRRLLAIARAVATRPSVLLLDEPAAGLSEAETRELARLVRRLADDWGLAILVVEHDVNFVMTTCDHIAVLDFGRKISEGPPSVVRTDRAVVAAYLGEPEEAVEGEPSVGPRVGEN
jgi:sulfate-transporting ATPase